MRIATFQRYAIAGDTDRAMARVADDLAWAAERGVDLALFPECYLTGHGYDPASILALAIERDGAVLRGLFAGLPPGHPMAIIGGFARRDAAVTNSAFVVAGGAVVGHYPRRIRTSPA